jgi:hypothetical protein
MTGQKYCVDCGAAAPKTETNYTLVGQRHGWRLTIVTDDAGRKSSVLRCPSCWAKYRQSAPSTPSTRTAPKLKR